MGVLLFSSLIRVIQTHPEGSAHLVVGIAAVNVIEQVLDPHINRGGMPLAFKQAVLGIEVNAGHTAALFLGVDVVTLAIRVGVVFTGIIQELIGAPVVETGVGDQLFIKPAG